MVCKPHSIKHLYHWKGKCESTDIHPSTRSGIRNDEIGWTFEYHKLILKYVRDGIHINQTKIFSGQVIYRFSPPTPWKLSPCLGRCRLNLIQWVFNLTGNSDSKITSIVAVRRYIRGVCICRYEEDPSGDLFSGEGLPTPIHCPKSLLGADVGSVVLWDCCEVHQLASQSTGIRGYGANRSRSQA
jgi:hypothetical protein